MSYLKWTSSNLLTCKVSIKSKKALNTKTPYLGTFAEQFNKNWSNFKSAPSNLWKHKVSSKTEKTFLGPKMLYLGPWAGIWKNYCFICHQIPPIYLMAKFHGKIRIHKFGTKNALFGCFGQQFWKSITIFEISAIEFALVQKIKTL